jgi:hypothetical protein
MIARNKPAVRIESGLNPGPSGRNRRKVVRVHVSYRALLRGWAFRPKLVTLRLPALACACTKAATSGRNRMVKASRMEGLPGRKPHISAPAPPVSLFVVRSGAEVGWLIAALGSLLHGPALLPAPSPLSCCSRRLQRRIFPSRSVVAATPILLSPFLFDQSEACWPLDPSAFRAVLRARRWQAFVSREWLDPP